MILYRSMERIFYHLVLVGGGWWVVGGGWLVKKLKIFEKLSGLYGSATIGWPFYNSKSSKPNGSASPFGRSWSHTFKTVEYVKIAEPLQNEHQALVPDNALPWAMQTLRPPAPTSASSKVAIPLCFLLCPRSTTCARLHPGRPLRRVEGSSLSS